IGEIAPGVEIADWNLRRHAASLDLGDRSGEAGRDELGALTGAEMVERSRDQRRRPRSIAGSGQFLREFAEPIRAGRRNWMIFGDGRIRRLVDHRRAWNEDSGIAAKRAQSVDQMTRAPDVACERGLDIVPGAADVRSAREVIYGDRMKTGESVVNGASIEDIDGLPGDGFRQIAGRRGARPMPRDELGAGRLQQLEKMASGKASPSGDKRRTPHRFILARRSERR